MYSILNVALGASPGRDIDIVCSRCNLCVELLTDCCAMCNGGVSAASSLPPNINLHVKKKSSSVVRTDRAEYNNFGISSRLIRSMVLVANSRPGGGHRRRIASIVPAGKKTNVIR